MACCIELGHLTSILAYVHCSVKFITSRRTSSLSQSLHTLCMFRNETYDFDNNFDSLIIMYCHQSPAMLYILLLYTVVVPKWRERERETKKNERAIYVSMDCMNKPTCGFLLIKFCVFISHFGEASFLLFAVVRCSLPAMLN